MLKNRLKNPAVASFNYDARYQQLTVFVGHMLHFNQDDGTFELDQNPHDEPDLVAIQELRLLDDHSGLVLRAPYRGEEVEFHVSIDDPVGRSIVAGMDALVQARYHFPKEGVGQQVSIVRKSDSVTLKAIKQDDEQDFDLLWLVSEGDTFYRVIPKPWQRLAITHMSMSGRTLSLTLGDDTTQYDFALDDVMARIVEPIVTAALRLRS